MQGIEVWRTISADPFETRLVAFRLLTLILAAAMLLRYTSSRSRLRLLIFTVIGVAVGSAVFGIMRQWTQHADGFVLPGLKPGSGYGQFINHNHFAFLMEMALGLLLGLACSGVERNHLARYLTASAFVAIALVLSNSRGGISSMFCQVLFVVLLLVIRRTWTTNKVQSKRRLSPMARTTISLAPFALTITLLAAMTASVVFVGGDSLVERWQNLPEETRSRETSRPYLWQATWRLFRANPVSGVGFGGYWVTINGYYDASGKSIPQQAHDDYLELLASGGLVAVALGAWFLLVFIRRARECLRSKSSFRRGACFGALAGLFAVAIHSIVDFGLHVTVNALAFTALIVSATVNVRAEEQVSQTGEARRRIFVWPSSFEILSRPTKHQRVIRSTIAVIGLSLCVMGIWTTGLAGLSRLSSHRAEKSDLLADANQAIRLSPADPVAHYVRGTVLSEKEQLPEAIEEFKRAVALRPTDHVLWLNLGFAYGQNGDQQSALAAFSEAVRLAPYYAAPRWQLGSLLLRAGQRDQAFAELRRAAQSDPALLPSVIGLAWDTYSGDVQIVEGAIRPETDKARVALAVFLIEHDEVSEVIRLFRATEKVSEDERRQILTGLLAAKRFTEAYQVWSGKDDVSSAIGSIQNAGFESKLVSDPNGFGWQFASDRRSVALKQVFSPGGFASPMVHSGTYSLGIDFNGDSVPTTNLVSQLVLVEPNARYQLEFWWRSQDLVSLGMPQIIVTDAGNGQLLAKSGPITKLSDWQNYTVALTTPSSTKALQIALCRQSADPIFGQLWLDDFTLRKN